VAVNSVLGEVDFEAGGPVVRSLEPIIRDRRRKFPSRHLALRLFLIRDWRSLRGFRLGFEIAKVAFPTRFIFQSSATGVVCGAVVSPSMSSFPGKQSSMAVAGCEKQPSR